VQLNLGPEKLRHKSCLSLIITAHFSFIIGANIAVGFQDQLMVSGIHVVCTEITRTVFQEGNDFPEYGSMIKMNRLTV
jgi:hypothetical protein